MSRITFGQEQWGWYAYADHNILVIGESFPHEGGDLYCGTYKGAETPYLMELKKDCPKIYNKIVKYFEGDRDDIEYLSDMERLKKVFATCNPRNTDRNLYYAVLAIVDEQKREVSMDYFRAYAREYLV